jgi:lysophospholipase L1-like esterase
MPMKFRSAFQTMLLAGAFATVSAQSHWVGTWACAPYDPLAANQPPSPGLSNNTLRQIVRVSIGGDTVRVKFTNATSTSATAITAVNLAVSTSGTDAINTSTITPLKFGGSTSANMAAGATLVSDPVAFHLDTSMRVAITIHYGSAPANPTGHVGARTPSYLLSGDKSTAANFSGATTAEHWYSISAIDVMAPASANAVAALGNSITDGYGLTGGLQNRWTDWLSHNLLANANTREVGVLNLGIGATNVASGTNCGIARYKTDILGQSGVKWLIIFYGVNDINAGTSASGITGAYQTIIADAHAAGMKVYGATITPFGGNSYYSAAHEATRSQVNAWIRTAGHFDAYIDFDHVVRDPKDTTSYLTQYKNDGLHPNAAGYQLLGQSIDVNLFATSSSVERETPALLPGGRAGGAISVHGGVPAVDFEGRRIDGTRTTR